MANKRTLKKGINLICADLFAEGVALTLYGPLPKKEGEALLYSIVKLQNHYITRISHPEPGISAKAYFKDLQEKFSAEANEVLDQMHV